MEVLPIGSGGGLRYLTEEPDPKIVNQQLPFSCQAACVRQLLRDAGIEIAEDELLSRIGYVEGIGTFIEPTAKALDDLHPMLGYDGGEVDLRCLNLLFQRDPWIAIVRTDRGKHHAVIVDAKHGDVVDVRDPWGLIGPGSVCGTRATLWLSDFLEHWHWAYYQAVYPNRRK